MDFKESATFRNAVNKAFKDLDADENGHCDYKEVAIGVLKVYDKLNAQLPGHVAAPSRRDMFEMCQKFDVDKDGCLDENEFYELSKVLFGTRRNWRESLPWVIGSALVLQLIIFPSVARAIVTAVQARSKEALYLPEAPLAALVGMLYHYIAKRA